MISSLHFGVPLIYSFLCLLTQWSTKEGMHVGNARMAVFELERYHSDLQSFCSPWICIPDSLKCCILATTMRINEGM